VLLVTDRYPPARPGPRAVGGVRAGPREAHRVPAGFPCPDGSRGTQPAPRDG